MPFLARVRRIPTPERTTAEDDLTIPSNPDTADRGRWRRGAAGVLTASAALLVLFALLAPNEAGRFTPGAFLRIPVEGLVVVALLLVLPATARRVATVCVGVALGLVTVVKIIDVGFFSVLARPFDPVLDWILFDDAVDVLTESIGRGGAVGIAIGAGLLAAAVLVLMTLAVRRLSRLMLAPHARTPRAVGALGVVWVTCAVLGAQIVPGVPVAADSAAALVRDRALQVRAGLQDQQTFAAEAAVDAFRDTPGGELLTGLRGKDVVFAFVESYGRDAIEDPEFAGRISSVLDDGDRRLDAAGFASRSAFLTSPTAGGGSWLAHATFLSGLWIDNEQRYRNLVSTDRLTLTGAFGRADWRTVGVLPGNTGPWPEAAFYGYDQVYDSRTLGYRGPNFGWAPIPDQYTLATFERTERAIPDRPPLMTEIPLVSSHWPWAPLPRMVGWDELGDGSIYQPMIAEGDPLDVVWSDPDRVRTEYARSIAYSLESLISYVETYGDDDLVLVVLGDHQPVPIVTGTGADHDVPISIITRDRAVLDRTTEWGWPTGLEPDPQAPVWRMDAFRDRFLTAFGPLPEPTH